MLNETTTTTAGSKMQYFNYLFDAATYDANSETKTRPSRFALECYAETREDADAKVAKHLRISVEALHHTAHTVTECARATTFLH